MSIKNSVKSDKSARLGFRVSPELKRAIWVEAAYAGITPSELMEEAAAEKVRQMMENRKREEEKSNGEAAQATLFSEDLAAVA